MGDLTSRTRPGEGGAPESDGEDHPKVTALTLDYDEAARRRDDGMTAAEHAVLPAWRALVRKAIDDLAAAGTPFTSEDLRARVPPPEQVGTSPNAIGAMLSGALTRGVVEVIGMRTSKRPEAHCRRILVYRGAAGGE